MTTELQHEPVPGQPPAGTALDQRLALTTAADVVISMGCADACPVLPVERYEGWDLADPAGHSLADVRPIRDDVERRVLNLLAELGTPHATTRPTTRRTHDAHHPRHTRQQRRLGPAGG